MKAIDWVKQHFTELGTTNSNLGVQTDVLCNQCTKKYTLRQGWKNYIPLVYHLEKSHGMTKPSSSSTTGDTASPPPATASDSPPATVPSLAPPPDVGGGGFGSPALPPTPAAGFGTHTQGSAFGRPSPLPPQSRLPVPPDVFGPTNVFGTSPPDAAPTPKEEVSEEPAEKIILTVPARPVQVAGGGNSRPAQQRLFSWAGCKSHCPTRPSEHRSFSRFMGPLDVPYVFGTHLERGEGLLMSLVCLGMNTNAMEWTESGDLVREESAKEEAIPGDVHILNALVRVMSNDNFVLTAPEKQWELFLQPKKGLTFERPSDLSKFPDVMGIIYCPALEGDLPALKPVLDSSSETEVGVKKDGDPWLDRPVVELPSTAEAWLMLRRLVQSNTLGDDRTPVVLTRVCSLFKRNQFLEQLQQAATKTSTVLELLERCGVSEHVIAEAKATAHCTIRHDWATEFYSAATVIVYRARGSKMLSFLSKDELARILTIAFDCVVATADDYHRRSLCIAALTFLCVCYERNLETCLGLPISREMKYIDKVTKLLHHSDEALVIPSIRLLGSFTAGDDEPLDLLLESGFLKALPRMLHECRSYVIPKDALWGVSNILAGTPAQVDMAMDAGCATAAIQFLASKHYAEVRYEALQIFITVFDRPGNVLLDYVFPIAQRLEDLIVNLPYEEIPGKHVPIMLELFVAYLAHLSERIAPLQDTRQLRADIKHIFTEPKVRSALQLFAQNVTNKCPPEQGEMASDVCELYAEVFEDAL